MQFILWRHAEAEIGTGNDLVRALTAKGHQQAKRTAHRINKMLPKSAKICVSEATRSQQTAAYCCLNSIPMYWQWICCQFCKLVKMMNAWCGSGINFGLGNWRRIC